MVCRRDALLLLVQPMLFQAERMGKCAVLMMLFVLATFAQTVSVFACRCRRLVHWDIARARAVAALPVGRMLCDDTKASSSTSIFSLAMHPALEDVVLVCLCCCCAMLLLLSLAKAFPADDACALCRPPRMRQRLSSLVRVLCGTN